MGPVRDHGALFIPDIAPADEVERREPVHLDVFGEQLHAGTDEPIQPKFGRTVELDASPSAPARVNPGCGPGAHPGRLGGDQGVRSKVSGGSSGAMHSGESFTGELTDRETQYPSISSAG